VAKVKDKAQTESQDKDREQLGGEERKEKGRKSLIRRVKKAVKKSRKRLNEERFEKELERTIAFLEEIRGKMGEVAAEPESGEASKLATEAASPQPSGRRRSRASKEKARQK